MGVEKDELFRLTVDILKVDHIKLKTMAATSGKSMREMVSGWIHSKLQGKNVDDLDAVEGVECHKGSNNVNIMRDNRELSLIRHLLSLKSEIKEEILKDQVIALREEFKTLSKFCPAMKIGRFNCCSDEGIRIYENRLRNEGIQAQSEGNANSIF